MQNNKEIKNNKRVKLFEEFNTGSDIEVGGYNGQLTSGFLNHDMILNAAKLTDNIDRLEYIDIHTKDSLKNGIYEIYVKGLVHTIIPDKEFEFEIFYTIEFSDVAANVKMSWLGLTEADDESTEPINDIRHASILAKEFLIRSFYDYAELREKEEEEEEEEEQGEQNDETGGDIS